MKHIAIAGFILLLIIGSSTQVQASGAPVITQQPVSQQMVDAGQSVTLTVAIASGTSTPSYQWWAYTYNGDTALWSWTKISGATQASYIFSAAVSTDADIDESNIDQYYCIITNSSGSTTSSVATVMVNTAPVYAPLPTSSSYVIVQQNTGNDTLAIQTAVNQQAGTGGSVYLAPGTYTINSPGINLPSNITLRFAPGAILQASGTTNYAILNIVDAANVYVIGGNLIGSGPTGNCTGTNIEGSTNVILEGVRSSQSATGFYIGAGIINPTSTNITLWSVLANNNGNQGLSIASANGLLITNSTFGHSYGTGSECGINVQPGSGNTVNNMQITNSALESNYQQGLCVTPGAGFITNMTVNGNIFSGNFGGLILNDTNSVTVSNNIINDSNVGGIYLGPSSTGNIISGNTITVLGTATGSGIVDNSGFTTNNIQSNTCNGTNCTTNIPNTVYSYTLTVNQSGNGTVSESPNSATYQAGSQVVLTATPSTGYLFSGWSGGASGNANPLTLTMTTNTSVTANFILQTETITASAGTGGTISPSGAVSVNYGSSQTFTVTPNAGYTAALTVDGSAASWTNNTYTFANVTSAHTIAVSFTLQTSTETITASAGTGGTISPSGTVSVNYGSSKTFTVNPNNGYTASLTDNGVSMSLKNSQYKLTNIISSHLIKASFTKNRR